MGDVVNQSNLVWYDVKSAAIDGTENSRAIVSTECYDAMGHRVEPTAKGLIIRRTTYADGTVETMKSIGR